MRFARSGRPARLRRMAQPRTVRLTHQARLDPPGPGYELRTVSADPGDMALAVWARPDGAGHRAVRYTPAPAQTWDIRDDLTPDFVQMLPGGRLLVAAGWSRDLPDRGRQTLVLGSDGAHVASGEFGNDVRHVLADAHGAVWVGYGDQGVYGAYEGEPEDRVSAHGLVRFTEVLRPAWVFPGDETDPIDDCYTLTLTGAIAWSYYYSEFPIVRIADGRVTSWQTEIEGAHALLISPAGDRACLIGDYDDPSLAVIGELAGDAFRPRTTTRLTTGRRGLSRAHLVARGPTLHAFTGTDWYSVSLDELS